MPTGVYPRDNVKYNPWNKGHTKETDPRLANQGMYDHTGLGFQKGSIPWNKALTKDTDLRVARQGIYPRTEHHRKISRNNGKTQLGKPAWNRGLTKEDHPGIARGAEAARQYMLGRHLSEETKEKQRGKRGQYRETGKRKESQDKFWAEISPELKSEFIRRSRLKTSKQKTKPEILLENLLDTHFSGEWKYVGDGQLIIAGMIPDFANIDGKKQLIEVFGDYWHREDNPNDRISKFSEYGYDCLVIWEHDIKINPNQVIRQVIEFSNRR